jgi:hypothetical protein
MLNRLRNLGIIEKLLKEKKYKLKHREKRKRRKEGKILVINLPKMQSKKFLKEQQIIFITSWRSKQILKIKTLTLLSQLLWNINRNSSIGNLFLKRQEIIIQYRDNFSLIISFN